MNYELHMAAALAEARAAAAGGELARGAVAILDDAPVARGRDQVGATGDPTAHAVMVVVREAARRLGRDQLTGVTVFTTHEPCLMCFGALVASDVDGLVYALAVPDRDGPTAVQLAPALGAGRRLHIVSGIMQAEAADLRAGPAAGRVGG